MSELRTNSLGKRLAQVALPAIAILVIAPASLMASVCLWWRADPGDAQRSRGVNALWAGHTWVGDEHTDTDYADFASLLKRNDISDVFFHAGPLEADGTVPAERTTHAAQLIAAMAKYAPRVRTQAYLGQIEKRGGGPLDLEDASVRSEILATDSRLLDMGFRGIHYDIEPINPGGPEFLDLLARTHELTQSRGAILSVAVEQLEPLPKTQRLLGWFVGDYHDTTKAFLQDVADRVDEVAVMTYDSGLPADWLFGAYMAWQTKQVVGAIGSRAAIFMGVPTYDRGSRLAFHTSAENMRSGLRGVRKGLDGLAPDSTQNVGLAIFAEWTTTDDEWATYETDWLRH